VTPSIILGRPINNLSEAGLRRSEKRREKHEISGIMINALSKLMAINSNNIIKLSLNKKQLIDTIQK